MRFAFVRRMVAIFNLKQTSGHRRSYDGTSYIPAKYYMRGPGLAYRSIHGPAVNQTQRSVRPIEDGSVILAK
jgi:hypothetical protein